MTEVEWKLCDGRAAVYAALRAQLAELDVPLRSLWARTPTAGVRQLGRVGQPEHRAGGGG